MLDPGALPAEESDRISGVPSAFLGHPRHPGDVMPVFGAAWLGEQLVLAGATLTTGGGVRLHALAVSPDGASVAVGGSGARVEMLTAALEPVQAVVIGSNPPLDEGVGVPAAVPCGLASGANHVTALAWLTGGELVAGTAGGRLLRLIRSSRGP